MSFEREMPFDLTDEEIREYSEQMARGVQDLEAMKEGRKIEIKRRNVEILALQEQVNELAGKVDSGVEMRSVGCSWQKCFEDATMQLIREDTQEIIDTRPMDETEKQMSFQHGQDQAGEEDKAA